MSVKAASSSFESRKELEGLKSIGKVKSFKQKINKGEIEGHPIKEIKKIVNAIEKDDTIETNIEFKESEDLRLSLDDEDKKMLIDHIDSKSEPKTLPLPAPLSLTESEPLLPEPEPLSEPVSELEDSIENKKNNVDTNSKN